MFGDATHLYAHDDYTSGNEFYAYSVDANGLTNIYGYTFFGFSEYYDSGFAIGADGLAYAPGGAIVNPANPPQQVALLPVTSSFGGEAVVPDTAQGFVFDVGGGNSPYGSNGISRFQLGTYVADASLPLPAPADGQSVSYTAVHFGQDGLALNVVPSYGDTSTVDSQVLHSVDRLSSPQRLSPILRQCDRNKPHDHCSQQRKPVPHRHRNRLPAWSSGALERVATDNNILLTPVISGRRYRRRMWRLRPA